MLFYLNSTANLGDFLNSLPVFSGLSKNYKFSLIIKDEMKKFNGLVELLKFQNIFDEIYYDTQTFDSVTQIFLISSWTRENKSDDNAPTETCRYENWIRDNFKQLTFSVDNDFILKVPDYNFDVPKKIVCGDRWVGPDIDNRRKSNILIEFNKLIQLDFSKSLLYNAYIIKHSLNPFISTFTGIAVLADLLGVEQYVIWGDDLDNWDNKPIEQSFYKHFYKNRNSSLININDFRIEYDRLLHRI